MKKVTLLSSILLLSFNVHADCVVADNINLCLSEINSDLSKTLTATKQVGDINGDGFSDIVKKENAQSINNRLTVYLGKSCPTNSDSALCFHAPHLTSIYPIKGFELGDLNNDGHDDLVIRDSLDQIKVYSFSELPIQPEQYVSLFGTNGLSVGSYTASSLYPGVPEGYRTEGAFDGYRHKATSPIVSVPGAKQGYGTWTSAEGSTTNQWLKVAFTKATKVNSFEIYARSIYPNRLPKNVTVQTSDDGINFINHESVTLAVQDSQTITLTNPTPFAHYFRLYMHDAQQGATYIQFDELLLKGWILE